MDERLTDLTVRSLIERLGTRDPVPGGGSASALAGAMAAALIRMVVELSVGGPRAEGHEDALNDIRMAAVSRQAELLSLAEQDASAYDAVVRARKLPRDSEHERAARTRKVDAALAEATRVPLATARTASAVLDLTGSLAPIGNVNAISDVGVAALLASASLGGAVLNVEINLPYVTDEALRNEAAAGIAALLATVDERGEAVRAVVADRLR